MPFQQSDILEAFGLLGDFLADPSSELEERVDLAKVHNRWFTPQNSRQMMQAVASNYLDRKELDQWLSAWHDQYAPASSGEKRVGVVAAGNLPLVAFHDILSVLVTGNHLLLKISNKDDVLLPYVLEKLIEFEPRLRDRIRFMERLKDFDAVIATGNDNSARYFEYYFGNVPNIIRKNRNSVAILTGSENAFDLDGLASDIFSYFGLGCRNVSKLYVPENYDLDVLATAFEPFRSIGDHNQYRNNLDYHRTILLMNNIPFENIDFINITHNPSISSPIANLHYEYYQSIEELSKLIGFNRDQIQCVVGNQKDLCTVGFGDTQLPGLTDYADEADTLKFLGELAGL